MTVSDWEQWSEEIMAVVWPDIFLPETGGGILDSQESWGKPFDKKFHGESGAQHVTQTLEDGREVNRGNWQLETDREDCKKSQYNADE